MNNILFINHKQQQCGVYQYGYRTAKILERSEYYNFIYCEVDNERDFEGNVWLHKPVGIFYNYHPSTMGWLNSRVLNKHKNIVHYGLHHEGYETVQVGFSNYIMLHPDFEDTGNQYSVPRPLIEHVLPSNLDISDIPIIGSFGFGFMNKGFERLVKLVNDQFDEAIIKLHIPFAYYGDISGGSAKGIARICHSCITKEKIKLLITHDFLTNEGIVNFLSGNTLNAFLYDEMPGRGIASVIDYALSVPVPIAITKTTMFRHISNTQPSICIEDKSLQEIIAYSSMILQPYRDKWSNDNLIKKYEYIIDKTI